MTPALERLLDGEVTRVVTGFVFAEGPVWHPDGHLLFTDVARSQILTWRPDQDVALWRDESGGAYGLALDADGRVIAAEHSARRVRRYEGDAATTLAESTPEQPLQGPSDVAVGPDGTIYFTDPVATAAGRDPPVRSGVYRIGPDGVVSVFTDDVSFPNGVAVSRDGATLFVSDGADRTLLSYAIESEGTAGPARQLASVRPWKRGVLGTADGITLDEEGRIYLAGPGGVWVLDQNGGRLGVIATPETPANCTFGDADRRTLYITARTSLYRVRMNVGGTR
jgi:sugar lactone lactonase YvrE